MHGAYPVARAPWDLFTFTAGAAENQVLVARGSLPWFSAPHLQLSALRPLSSLLIWFDHRVLGASPVLHHVHSMLWWGAMIAAVGAMLRQVLAPKWAWLALLLFVVDDAHVYPLAWLANRSVLVSMTFGALGLWGHLRWRRGKWSPGAWISVLALVLCVAAGEYGVAMAAYVLAYELVGHRGSLRGRAKALIGPASIVAFYVLVHQSLGYGAKASGIYADPLGDPLGYLAAIGRGLPLLSADVLFGAPVEWLAQPSLGAAWVPWGCALAVVSVVALLPAALRRRSAWVTRSVRWLGLGAAISMLPLLASFLSGRLGVVPSIGGHVIVALLVLDGLSCLRRRPAGIGRIARGGLAVLLLGAHAIADPILGHRDLKSLRTFNRIGAQRARAMPVEDAAAPQQRWVVLTVSDPMTLIYPPWVRWSAGHPLPVAWWVLSMAPVVHRMTRVAPDALILEVEQGAMLRTPVEQLFARSQDRFEPGTEIDLEGMRVRIEHTADDGAPTRVRYIFDRPLEDPSLRFFMVSPAGLLRYPMGPVGSTVRVAPGAHPLAGG